LTRHGKHATEGIEPAIALDDGLEVVLNAIPQPIILKDEHSRFLFLNDAACALAEGVREDLIGLTDHEVLPASEADRIARWTEESSAPVRSSCLSRKLPRAEAWGNWWIRNVTPNWPAGIRKNSWL
jgi:PAS domain-containing protein